MTGVLPAGEQHQDERGDQRTQKLARRSTFGAASFSGLARAVSACYRRSGDSEEDLSTAAWYGRESEARLLVSQTAQPGFMDAVHDYVSRTIRGGIGMDLALATGAALGGLAVVTLSFYAAYFVLVILFFLLPVDIADGWFYAGSAAFLVAVFFESWHSQRKLFEGYPNDPGLGGAAGSAALYILGLGWGPTGIIPLSSGTARNLPKAMADLLFSGPRLLRNSVRLLRRARERGAVDLADSSRILELVLQASGRVTLHDISTRHAEIDLPTSLQQLSRLDGVIYLDSDPPGLTLTDTLRAKLEQAVEGERG